MEGNWLIKKCVKTIFLAQQVENGDNNLLVETTFFFKQKDYIFETNYAKLYFQREK